MSRKIEIEIPEGKRAKWNNGVLTFVDCPKNIIDRIKTFEDACSELGENHQYIRAYREWMRISYAECEDITAYMKLRIITAALNEGWEPKFVEGETQWIVRYNLMTMKEYVHAVNEKLKLNLYFVGNKNVGINSLGTCYASINSSSLVFRTKELAEYAAKQFIDIYADYCFKV